jgi:uncharacterized repeat protein (TIGR03803 family)
MCGNKSLGILGAALIVTLTVILVLVPGTWAASTYKVLHSFTGKDGAFPFAGLVSDTAGNLYGTTFGWSSPCGTAFKLAQRGHGTWTRTVLHYFTNGTGDKNGCNPYAGMTLDAAGNLYGTTISGGDYDEGTVFELSPVAHGNWTEKVLHSFSGKGNDGSVPYAGLIFDAAGNLYGTTSAAGGVYRAGTVFELLPRANGKWTEKVLHVFGRGKDGAAPQAALALDAAGNLYGTTSSGGANIDYGTVFELAPSTDGGWKESVLYSFCSLKNCSDGSGPYAGLIFDAAGNLYGTTIEGGASNSGTVFELKPGGGGSWTESVLYSFCTPSNCTDGAVPRAGLIFDTAGNLYGTTTEGGHLNCGTFGSGCGTVFELVPSGGQWTETVLHAFFEATGEMPFSGVILDAAGNLYGTTYSDVGGYGTVFEVTP